MHHAFDQARTARLPARQLGGATLVDGDTEACNAALPEFNNQYAALPFVGVLFVVLPLLVGLFWGAPLVAREVEHGTHRLVWTQGVSRRHWALVKFGLVGAVTLIVAAVYGLGLSWWMRRWARPVRCPGSTTRLRHPGHRPDRVHAVRCRAGHLRRHDLAARCSRRWRSPWPGTSGCGWR